MTTHKTTCILDFVWKLKKDDVIAVEATGNALWFVDSVKAHVKKVVVVDPNKFQVIKKSTNMNDEKAAKTLAFFLSKDMLPKARLKMGKDAELSSVVATRDRLVKLRTVLYNKIHNILNAHGDKSRKKEYGTEKGLASLEKRLETAMISSMTKIELEVVISEIRSLNVNIKKLEACMVDEGSKMDGHANLASIKGIGDKAATILLTEIGNVNDFEDENKLAAYFGMVPKVSRSNETVHYGRITRKGSKIGRTTMVQCGLIAKRYSPYLAKFYERIRKRRGTAKAIIAVARKLLTIVYYTLKEKRIYTDFAKYEFVTT